MQKPIRVLKLTLFVCASLVLAAACSQPLATPTVTPSPDPTREAMVVMTGTLQKPDLAAVVGSAIMLAASDAQGAGIMLAGDGTPLNPEGKIAESGKFTIGISREFLETVHYKVKLVLISGPYPADLLDQNGNPMVVTIGRTLKSVELGNVPAR
jgi:hypothetical protein